MTVATDPGDVMLDRFLVLRRWLRELHVCWRCSDTFAWVQIEREGGNKGVKPVQECGTPERCRDRANAGRKTMPPPIPSCIACAMCVTSRLELTKGPTMTKKLKQWRQGDVFIEQVDEAVDGRKRLDDGNGRVVLALGEVTGHSHRIESPHAALYLEQATTAVPDLVALGIGGGLIPDRLLQLDKPAAVVHEEHGSISLDAGTYRIRIQKEYSPGELRNVCD